VGLRRVNQTPRSSRHIHSVSIGRPVQGYTFIIGQGEDGSCRRVKGVNAVMPRPPTGANEVATSTRVYTEAARLFHEVGYAAATTRELAARLGLNKASLYYHVPKKEDLLYNLCTDALDRIEIGTASVVDNNADARGRLEALIEEHLTGMLSDIEMHAAMLLERRHLSAERFAEIVQRQTKYQHFVEGVISYAQAASVCRTDLSSRDLAIALLNQMNWYITWYRPGGLYSIEQCVNLTKTIFFDGAVPR
jgi:AcrR family transcriptional regulator